jgi:class 3 adenylate cyclase
MIIDNDTKELLKVKEFEKKDQDQQDFRIFQQSHIMEDEKELEKACKSGFFCGDNTLTGITAQKGGIIIRKDALEKPEFKGLANNGPFPTMAVGALTVKDRVLGLLHIESTGDYELTQEDVILFSTICSMVSLTMDSAHLFELTKKDLISSKQITQQQIEANRTIKKAFETYLSPKLVETMLQNPSSLKLGGEKRILTVFFSDIRGFTTYSEKYDPETIVSILNEYLTAMTDIIIEFDGTLDKFVGDEIMAIWGAPVPQKNHARLAVAAAIKMLEKLKALQKEWISRGIEPIDIGMGINTGEMVVGNMGSLKRMDYTVIGDNVNIGARLEALTRTFNYHLIISESTFSHVSDMVETNELEPVTVKGKTKPVLIYGVKSIKENALNPHTNKPFENIVFDDRLLHLEEQETVSQPQEKIIKAAGNIKKSGNTKILSQGMQEVECLNCGHNNIGKTLMYCEKCGLPL